ncbi:Protein of unknown function DUF3468 [Penicillium expansum]|uniref:Zn(2)-C6 fungal-type domain-containing protein n=1 Tax=Penicillium expansum TaxID=27334 RepID=A0A0A2JBB1_PENEN|nr:Protein of unknown function DUF3468 [Penicillium expansum]KGO43666.1 Protein of unknown function DUF3468 [Penicillium expansum]KGO52692.1 Protein of unknown function DUF3468 [Penicillium expansum]KGO57841.1 Protein of unknown function DUF3468 [Penicillium expansum]
MQKPIVSGLMELNNSTDIDPWGGILNWAIDRQCLPIDPAIAGSSSSQLPTTRKTIEKPRAGRRGGRVYTGCFTCRQRKIKCDGRRPTCANCERSRRHVCHGFIVAPAATTAIAQIFDNKAKAAPVLHTQRSEADQPAEAFFAPSPRISIASSPLESVETNENLNPPIISSPGGTGMSSPESMDNSTHGQTTLQTPPGWPSNRDGPDDHEVLLIRHYREVVGHIMMPAIDSPRNPWLQIYLPLALARSPDRTTLALRHAILAVSALHRAQPSGSERQSLLVRAKVYALDAAQLVDNCLSDSDAEYAEAQKHALLACTLSLISSNVFASDSKGYQEHLDLAHRVFTMTGSSCFWRSSFRSSVLYQIYRFYELLVTTTQGPLGSGPQYNECSPTKSASPDEDADNFSTFSRSSMEFQDPERIAMSSHYVLDTCFGISQRTISLLYRTVRADRQIAKWDPRVSIEESLVKEFEDVRAQLYDITLDSEALSRSALNDEINFYVPDPKLKLLWSFGEDAVIPTAVRDELLESHQWAFHNAVILFFGRCFDSPQFRRSETDYPDKGRPRWANLETPFQDYQKFVALTFDSLETIQCLTRGRSIRPAITLWPALVAACEAVDVELRHRCLQWFQNASAKGIGNLSRARALVLEVWKRTDRHLDTDGRLPPSSRGLGFVDWRDVMAELKTPIMLT